MYESSSKALQTDTAKAKTASTGNTKWNEMFNKVDEYRKKHGKWPPATEKTCGKWVDNQRTFGRKFNCPNLR